MFTFLSAGSDYFLSNNLEGLGLRGEYGPVKPFENNWAMQIHLTFGYGVSWISAKNVEVLSPMPSAGIWASWSIHNPNLLLNGLYMHSLSLHLDTRLKCAFERFPILVKHKFVFCLNVWLLCKNIHYVAILQGESSWKGNYEVHFQTRWDHMNDLTTFHISLLKLFLSFTIIIQNTFSVFGSV